MMGSIHTEGAQGEQDANDEMNNEMPGGEQDDQMPGGMNPNGGAM